MIKRMSCRKLLSVFLLILLPVAVFGCSSASEPGKLTVFAAAGAKPAIDEIGQKFQEQYGVAIEVSYGGGGEVLSQMILSRSGDIYIAPEQGFMEKAKEEGVIKPETVRSVAYMIPVIAVQKGNPRGIEALSDLAKPGIRVAITRPETTLLGKYAPEIFEKAGLAEAMEKNIVTYAARPDNLLTMLVMGQVDAGIIWHFYQTMASDKIETIFLAPEQLTGIGEMQIAVSTYSVHSELAQQFTEFVTSAEGKAVFERCGYFVDAEEVNKYWH